MTERKITRCTGCVYHRSLGSNSGLNYYACHYCIDTGTLRGYSAEACYRNEHTAYTPKKERAKRRKRERPPVPTSEEILRALMKMKDF